jgi:hypothetical protein
LRQTTILGALLISGCGSTVTVTSPGPPMTITLRTTAAATAYVYEAAPSSGPYLSRPSRLIFSVDGDLEAEHLEWMDWGSPITVGSGTFLFRSYPSNAVAAVPGTVTLSERVTCNGKFYYRAGVVHAPGAPFKPYSPTSFTTPCNSRTG